MTDNPLGTTVILIRHADRTSATTADPPLNPKGKARAQELIHVLGHSGIEAIYHSHFTRAKQTAQPLAAHLPGIATKQIDEALEIKNDILANHAGKAVLVIGHSDTVPDLINQLSEGHMPVIHDSEFDNLFIVTVLGTGKASLTRLKYGGLRNSTLAMYAACQAASVHRYRYKTGEFGEPRGQWPWEG